MKTHQNKNVAIVKFEPVYVMFFVLNHLKDFAFQPYCIHLNYW